jgi:hypothetical protein
MATFNISVKQAINLDGEYVDKGLSVQISSMNANPFNDADKINDAFKRIHGLDLKSAGYLSSGYLTYTKV